MLPKLVRDLIPDRIKKDGETPHIQVIDGELLWHYATMKVLEEVDELQKARSRAAEISELADLADVLELLCELKSVTPRELAATRAAKKLSRGGFDQRILLVRLEKKND